MVIAAFIIVTGRDGWGISFATATMEGRPVGVVVRAPAEFDLPLPTTAVLGVTGAGDPRGAGTRCTVPAIGSDVTSGDGAE